MDQIDIDSTAAMQRGISYGRFIALYGHVKDVKAVLESNEKYKACICCGGLFETKGNKKFCSSRCAYLATRDERRARARARDGVTERTVTCSVCGNIFTTHYGHQMTCSRKCSNMRAAMKMREKYYQKKSEGVNEQT